MYERVFSCNCLMAHVNILYIRGITFAPRMTAIELYITNNTLVFTLWDLKTFAFLVTTSLTQNLFCLDYQLNI